MAVSVAQRLDIEHVPAALSRRVPPAPTPVRPIKRSVQSDRPSLDRWQGWAITVVFVALCVSTARALWLGDWPSDARGVVNLVAPAFLALATVALFRASIAWPAASRVVLLSASGVVILVALIALDASAAPVSFLLLCLTLALLELRRERDSQTLVRRQLASAREQAAAARLALLRQQVRPRFLLRAVNAAWAMMIEKRHDESEDLAVALGDYIGLSVASTQPALISLATELENVRRYLDVEQLCCGHRLVIDISCGSDAAAQPVPARLLQALIERAVDLGVARSAETMMLTIVARRIGRTLRLAIRSEVESRALETDEGTAVLEQVTRLLGDVYGARASVSLEQAGHYSAVVIAISDLALEVVA